MGSFFKRGNTAQKEEYEKQAERRKVSNRFYIDKKKTEECKKGVNVIFLESLKNDRDEGTLGLWEHHLRVNGDRNWHVPCTADLSAFDGCFVCEQSWKDGNNKHHDYPRSFINITTIIDTRVVKSQDGKREWKNTKKLYTMKTTSFEKLCLMDQDLREEGHPDGLKGQLVRIRRIGEMAERVGDDFGHKSKVNPAERPVLDAEGKEVTLEAFDYDEIFHFMTRDEMKNLFETSRVELPFAGGFGSSGSTTTPAADGEASGDTPEGAENEEMPY